MNAVAYLLAFFSLLMSCLLFLRIKAPLGFIVLFPKLAAGALSPLWVVIGLLGAVLGWLGGAPLAVVGGSIGALCMAWYVRRVTAPHRGFEPAFGADWQKRIPAQRASHMLKRRWTPFLQDPKPPQPCWMRNLAFWTIPGTDRRLLCDLWQPPEGTAPSGVALVFLHGSAWTVFDKDFGTRPFFRHLVAQGHVVMDVAYRLCPEVDIYGMVGDVKRAVAWMKANADRYGVSRERIVLGGASAGGHLSMLAAYAPGHPLLTPEDVQEADLSVRGVISYYGPSDLRAVYEHTGQQRLVGLKKVPIGRADALGKSKKMVNAGRLDMLLGGHVNEIPDVYDLASPVTHVHPSCPPTLLIQGEHDIVTPIAATRAIYDKLVSMGVPAVNVVFPCTDHAFDLVLPRVSPSSQSALYDVDRFLALLE